jgi:hypothetical protein
MFIQSAQAFAEQEARLNRVESRMEALESRNQGEAMAFATLPCPVPALSHRDLVNMAIRGYCQTHDHNFQSAWNRLYTEFRYRYHTDLLARARAKGARPLDVAEEMGVMSDLYDLAVTLFTPENIEYRP